MSRFCPHCRQRFYSGDTPCRCAEEQMSLPYQPHSPESKEAAKLAETDAGTARARVLKIIRAFGVTGITDEGIQKALRMDPSTERPRRVELVKAGLVEKHPNLTSTTSRGRKAAMWRAV